MNPADPTGKTMYPSGIKDIDKQIFSDLPASMYPQLRLLDFVYDKDGRLIEPGFYEVIYRQIDNMIELFQGNTLYGKFDAVKEKDTVECKKLSEISIIKKDKKYIIIHYKKDCDDISAQAQMVDN